ncbi:MAG: response regulator [Peptostreptococcaceae bacterium]|nr:response regulator [Peptostreptococcaceae bacterium]
MKKEKYTLSKEYITLLNTLPIAIFVFQKIGKEAIVIHVNKVSEKLFNMGSEEIMEIYNGDIYSKVHPYDEENLKDKTKSLFKGEPDYNTTYRIKLKDDGEYIYIEEKGKLQRMEDGTDLGIIAIDNVSEEVISRNIKIELLNKKYNDAMRNKGRIDTNLIAFLQVDFTINKVIGGEFSEIINEGEDFTDVIKKEIECIVDPTERMIIKETLTQKYLEECAYGGNPISLIYRRKSIYGTNKTIWIRNDTNFSINPLNNHILAYVYLYDVDEEKETERFLKYTATYNYDFVQRVDINTDKYTTFVSSEFKDKFLSRIDGIDYFNRFINNNELEYGLEVIGEDLKKEKIIKYLDKNIEYTRDFTVTDENNELKYKRVTIRFIDNSKNILCVMQQDFTKSMIAEMVKSIKLENALNTAKEASKIKSDFLANMSHDMRTPMNAIIGLSNFGYEESNQTKIKEYFNQIIDSSGYLLNLLNDLLDINKLENGSVRLNKNVILLSELTEEVLNIIRPRAEDKNQKLTIEGQYFIDENYYVIDKQRIQQVLINVLSNAIKYTEKGGFIKWEIKLVNKDKKLVMVNTISDSGVGISEDYIPHIFEAFSQEKNILSISEGGSGLGLAISKNLLELMGGKINCESSINEGSVFNIEVPLKKAAKKELKKLKEVIIKEMDIDFTNKSILICEDNIINVKIASKIVEDRGAKVEIALNGKIAVDMAEENKYDCILMDIRMPVMDGIEAAKKIREKDSKVPIIALSANAYSEDMKESMKAGMNAHIAKPIDRKQLLETIASVMLERENTLI